MKKILLLIFILQLCSCKNETNQKTSSLSKDKDSLNLLQSTDSLDLLKNKDSKEKVFQNTEEKYVIAKSGLNYRTKPKGTIIGNLKYGTKLRILKHTNNFETIEDNNEQIEGEWLKIKINDKPAYVFDGYLSTKKEFDSNDNLIRLKNEETSIQLLLPIKYCDQNNKNRADNIDENWLEFNKNNNKYYLSKANYTIERDDQLCSCKDSTSIIKRINKTLFYINDSKMKLGEITSVEIIKDKIWPTEKTSLKFNNIEYNIRAEGKIIVPNQQLVVNREESVGKIENYKLFISTNNSDETLILEENLYEYSTIRLIFAGDIDFDGRLDFIISYGVYEGIHDKLILYLSSKATENEIIKKVSEFVSYQFC